MSAPTSPVAAEDEPEIRDEPREGWRRWGERLGERLGA
jgi:hypothetical protein